MRAVFKALLVTLASASCVSAAVVTTVDTTPGTATKDGTINSGEYVSGPISGINNGFGDVIGATSTFYIDSDTSGNLDIGMRKGNSSQEFNNVAVIWIDSKLGGVADNALITDNSSRDRASIAGNGEFGGSSTLSFAPGFTADYAITVSSKFDVASRLYSIDSATGALTFVRDNNLTIGGATPNEFSQDREIALTLGDIGVAQGGSFNYFVSYIDSGSAYLSNEFVGVASFPFGNPGNVGSGTTLNGVAPLSAGDFNTFTSVPEPASIGLLGLAGLVALRRKR